MAPPLDANGNTCGEELVSEENVRKIHKHHRPVTNTLPLELSEIDDCAALDLSLRLTNSEGNPVNLHGKPSVEISASRGVAFARS